MTIESFLSEVLAAVIGAPIILIGQRLWSHHTLNAKLLRTKLDNEASQLLNGPKNKLITTIALSLGRAIFAAMTVIVSLAVLIDRDITLAHKYTLTLPISSSITSLDRFTAVYLLPVACVVGVAVGLSIIFNAVDQLNRLKRLA